jgi:signal transduction histidine kinase
MAIEKPRLSTPARTGIIYAAFFLAAVFAIFAATYLSVRADMRSAMQASVGADIQGLLTEFKSGGIVSLKEAVEERLAETQGLDRVYVLTDGEGTRIAGNLKALPVAGGAYEGPAASLTEPLAADTDALILFGETRPVDGMSLFVGRDASSMYETLETILASFLIGAVLTSVAALLIGVLLGLYSTRRIEAISRTTRAIVQSGLKERVPLAGGGDEFDGLSHDINVMLDRIEELMESMRQMSSDIAHELRMPLSRMRQSLEKALSGGKPSVAALKAAVAGGIGETDGIIATFNALLSIAQIEGGARRAGFKRVSLSEIMLNVHEIYQPVAEDSDLVFTTEIQPGVMVTGDSDLLTQLFVNLVENAIRFVPRGGRLVLSLKATAEAVHAIVSDNGPGIAAAEREKVFRRLYRSEQSRTTTGSGLGLSLVDAIAGLHNAKVTLHDNQPGLRAEFVMDRAN